MSKTQYFVYFHGYSARMDSIIYSTPYIAERYKIICLSIDFENSFKSEANRIYEQLQETIDYSNSTLVGHSMGSIILISIVYKFLTENGLKPKKIILLAPALTVNTDIDNGLSYVDLQRLTTNRMHLNTFMLFRPLLQIIPNNMLNKMFSNDIAWKIMVSNTILDKNDAVNSLMDYLFDINNDNLWSGKQLSIALKSVHLYPNMINIVGDILNLFNKYDIDILIIHAEDDSLISIYNSQEIEATYDNIYLYKVDKELKQGHFPYKSLIYFV